MKFVKVLFLTLLGVVVILVIGIFLFLKTFDVNKYKPQIIREITKAIGRDADIQSLALQFSAGQGVTLNMKGLTIADDAAFSKENFLSAENISLGIVVLPFLTERQIYVSSLQIQSPKIVLIRDKNGKFNVQTFKTAKEGVSLNPSESPKRGFGGDEALAAESDGNNKNPLPVLLIKSARLNNGTLIYKDKALDPAISIEVNQLNLKIDDFFLDKPFDFSLEGSCLSPRKNITMQGRGQVDIPNTAFRLNDVKITSDLSDLSLEQLVRSLPMAQSAGLQKNLEGQIQVSIKEMVVGPKGLAGLALDGKLIAGKAKVKYAPLPLEHITADFHMTGKAVDITDSSLSLGKGTIKAKGRIDDYLKSQKFEFETQASDLDLTELVSQKDQSTQFQGKLAGQFNVSGSGLSAAAVNSLQGDGVLEVKEGRLVGINILKLVLSKISMLPHAVEQIEANLPEKYKEKMKEPDTVFQKIKLDIKIVDRSMVIDRTQVLTDVFALSGNGRIKFNQELNMEATITVPADLSQSMVTSAEGLQYLVDEKGEIAIPLRIVGRIPALMFYPDLEYLGKRIMQTKGREEIDKILDKVFEKIEKTPSTPSSGGPDSQPTTTGTQIENKSPERQLIESILDKVLKK